MRRATCGVRTWNSIARFQSTLSMRRATNGVWIETWVRHISIHALHEESDPSRSGMALKTNIFQSTLSMRRATHRDQQATVVDAISIHALHEESDVCQRFGRVAVKTFQSTLSMRRATSDNKASKQLQPISIHALHEESDSAAGHFCPLFETQASCLALSISNNTADTTNNMSKTSNWLSVSF